MSKKIEEILNRITEFDKDMEKELLSASQDGNERQVAMIENYRDGVIDGLNMAIDILEN